MKESPKPKSCWKGSHTISLANAIREHPILWDPENQFHTFNEKRGEVIRLLKLVDKFPVDTEEELNEKIKSMISQFKKYHNQYTKCKSGSEADFAKKWYAYDSLIYIKDKCSPVQNVTSEDVVVHDHPVSKIYYFLG